MPARRSPDPPRGSGDPDAPTDRHSYVRWSRGGSLPHRRRVVLVPQDPGESMPHPPPFSALQCARGREGLLAWDSGGSDRTDGRATGGSGAAPRGRVVERTAGAARRDVRVRGPRLMRSREGGEPCVLLCFGSGRLVKLKPTRAAGEPDGEAGQGTGLGFLCLQE